MINLNLFANILKSKAGNADFGDQFLIISLYNRIAPGCDLNTFKGYVLAAMQAGFIQLERLDFVSAVDAGELKESMINIVPNTNFEVLVNTVKFI